MNATAEISTDHCVIQDNPLGVTLNIEVEYYSETVGAI
jgi:hypothetical protein